MVEISVVTINILVDLSLWKKRRLLLVDQLFELDSDIIALQEVSLKDSLSTAHWIADELNQMNPGKEIVYQVYLCPRSGNESESEAIAILSRLPVKRHQTIDLKTQNRVAQIVELKLTDGPLLIVNSHFYWKVGESETRKDQIELLLDYLDLQPPEIPVLVVGDFNCEPGMPSIDLMRRYFDSAHRAVHGKEPEFTYPTPLPKTHLDDFRLNILHYFGKDSTAEPSWKGTVDYIFVDPRVNILDCRVVLDQPDPVNSRLYPSDHFGLYSLIRIY
jgi:endonuclease/exonuclease/phosphatase family metal-dependent hydrolase